MSKPVFLPLWLGLSLLCIGAPALAAQTQARSCVDTGNATGQTATVAAAVAAFKPLLSAAQRAAMEKPLTWESAIQWSNLPVGVVPRTGLRLGDLDDKQSAAARRIFAAALSTCGLQLLDEVRLADDYLIPFDKRPIGWDGRNYYLSEPIRFEMKGQTFEPLTKQSTAMSRLAMSLAGQAEARLSGTFTDVVKGVVPPTPPGQPQSGGVDRGFPHTYPTGAEDRGIRVRELSAAQRALVRDAIHSYVDLPGAAISERLSAAYLEDSALDETFVGFAGAPDLSARGSYVRIDGPRLWMELVVQPAVADPRTLHYHTLWRDKVSDYGGEIRP
ncbi:MAG: hypothetical protein K0Q92_3935 [Steroidobacteraceae bacterium]|nr:hypothetical protein [Steroidobacteraceae bacterium]